MYKFCDTLNIMYIHSLDKKECDDIYNTIVDKKIVDIKKYQKINYIFIIYYIQSEIIKKYKRITYRIK